MVLFYGFYKFLIKSYSAFDLKLQDKVEAGTQFEVRQRCFHLFWIPFFPAGKVYQRQENGLDYPMEPGEIALVEARGKHRAPWYSFLLIFLLVLGIGGGVALSEYRYYMSLMDDYQRYQASVRNIEQRVEQLDSNCLITFNKTGWAGLRDDIYLKVKEADANSVRGYLFKIDRSRDLGEKYPQIEDYAIELFYADNRERFEDDYSLAEIKKEDLKRIYFKSYSEFRDYEVRKKSGIQLKGSEQRYRFTRIINWTEPNLKITSLKAGKRGLYLQLVNRGRPVIIKKIQDIKGKEFLTYKMPLTLPTSTMEWGSPKRYELNISHIAPSEPLELRMVASLTDGKDVRYKITARENRGILEKAFED